MTTKLIKYSKIFGKILLGLLIFILIALGFARLFFNQLDQYKPHLEQWASDALHHPVKIEKIQAVWKGFYPHISMENVSISDTATTVPSINIQYLELGANLFASLLHQRLVPSLLKISGTQIQVHRVNANTISLNDILFPFAKNPSTDTEKDLTDVMSWLLHEHAKLSLDNVALDWQNENGDIIQLKDIKVILSQKWLSSQLIGTATVINETPTRLRIVVDITQKDLYAQNIKANFYLFIKRLDLAPWFKNKPIDNIKIDQGTVENLHLWANWENGKWQTLQTLINLDNFALNFINSTPALPDKIVKKENAGKNKIKKATVKSPQSIFINHLSANIAWEQEENGFSLAADQIQLVLNQQTWPINHMSMRKALGGVEAEKLVATGHLNTHKVLGLETRLLALRNKFNNWTTHIPSKGTTIFRVDSLNIKQVLDTLENFYLPDSVRETLNTLQPTGMLNQVLMRQDTTTTGEAMISAYTEFKHLKVPGIKEMPGVDGLQGSLHIMPTAGDLHIFSKPDHQKLEISLPAWFKHTIKLDAYAGRVQWAQAPDGLTIQATDVDITDPYLSAKMDFALWMPNKEMGANQSAYMRLWANFSEHDASHIRDYIPENLLTSLPALATWLREAFVTGDSVEGEIQLQGPLDNFPFDDKSGQFNARAKVENMLFNYKTGWPSIVGLDAEVIFKGRSLVINGTSGNILGAATNNTKAQIADLAHAELNVQSDIQTNMQTGLNFIAQSPLQKTIGLGLDILKLKGDMQLNLGLKIPFYDADLHVDGKVQILPHGQLSLPDWKINFTDLQGALRFTEDGLYAKKLTASWLQEPVVMQIDTTNTKNNTTIEIGLNGHTSMHDIQKIYGLTFLQEKIKGETDYKAIVQIAQQGGERNTQVSISSDLQGIEIDFPEPLKKLANEKLLTQVDITPQAKTGMHIALQYAKKFAATAVSNANGWQLSLNSPTIIGQLTIPHQPSQPIIGNFQRFNLHSGVSQTVSRLNPSIIPPLNLKFQNFSYDDKSFGAISLLTQPGKNSMEIQQLSLHMANMSLLATGRWQKISDKQQFSIFNGNLTSHNLGAALKAWDITGSVVNGEGNIAFQLSWPAAVYDFSAKKLNGDVSLSFTNGRIINISNSSSADMGVGRILNLLSLQSIPRRLSFDFSDLVQEGFAFDKMKGDFKLVNGNATTENAYLHGPIAKVQVMGRIGMADKDYNLRMIVTPYITSSIPVAATIIGGPVLGAAAWVGNKILGSTVNKIASKIYEVKGGWDNPTIEAVQQ